MKWHFKRLMALCMVFSLVIATGCQSIGGLDLNQVLKNSLKVTSAEGTSEFEFKLNLNLEEVEQDLIDSMYTEEEVEESLKLIEQLTHVKLVIEQYKVKDNFNASYKGYIALGDKEKIGFKLAISDALLVLHLDGAKKSFAFDLTGEYSEYVERKRIAELYGDEYAEVYAPQGSSDFVIDSETEATITKLVEDISELITNYSIGILPNIDTLKVSPETATINNEATSLMMVRGELQGLELWNWLNSLLDAILNDREGIENLVDSIFTIYESNQEVIGNMINESLGLTEYDGGYEEEYYDEEFINEEFTDEEFTEEDFINEEQSEPLTLDGIKKQFVDGLFEMLEELKKNSVDQEQNNKEQLKQIFNDSLKITFEYGVDAGLNTRQQGFTVDYTLDEASKEYSIPGVEGFSIKSSSTLWNINGEVKSDEPRKSLSTVYIEELPYMQGFEVANLFEKGSYIDYILRDQLQITEQHYFNYVSDMELSIYLNESKQAMLPLRHITKQFGAKLTYDDILQSARVYDVATNTIIELQVGSNVATINGEQVQWSAAVELKDGYIYVPARSFAEALGAELKWDGTGIIEITRIP